MTDFEEYEEFLGAVENHPSWDIDYAEGRDRQKVAQDAEERGTTYRAKHSDTGAVLSARLNQDLALSTATLEQPLDEGLKFSESEFASSLARAHKGIAAASQNDYVEPKEDTYSIARLEVPRSYGEEELVDAIDELDTISVNVHGLHEDLIEVVETWE